MENEFFKIHGKSFTKQPNIRLNLISHLKLKCPEIPHDAVNLFARSRIYFRCNYLNKKAHDEAIKLRIEKRVAKAKAIEEAKESSTSNINVPLTQNIIRDPLEIELCPLQEIVLQKKSQKKTATISKNAGEHPIRKGRKRAAKVPVHLTENYNIDNSVDIDRKKRRKLNKFVT